MRLEDYWMKRDRLFAADLTPEIVTNAVILVERVHKLLKVFGEERDITSGWRPPSVNGNTPGAALRSKHMTGQAIDLADPEGDLDDWCMDHLDMLEHFELWLEHPSATKNWCHLQSLPPKSNKRVFYP